ncbi:MAG: MMPL family transporter [Tepidamorphaceae bacterium]
MQPKVSRVIAVTDVLKAGGEAYGRRPPHALADAGRACGCGLNGHAWRGNQARRGYQVAISSRAQVRRRACGRGQLQVIVILQSAASDDILSFAEDAEGELERLGAARATTATGMPVLAAHLSQRNGASMIKGHAIRAAISLLMVLALGSWRLGLASLVPNLMPLLMAYGVWGLVMGDLTFAGTMVIAMTFGIVVDDTVHMMSRYRHLRKAGFAPRAAMVETFRTVGIAVFTTTVAIASGFSVCRCRVLWSIAISARSPP